VNTLTGGTAIVGNYKGKYVTGGGQAYVSQRAYQAGAVSVLGLPFSVARTDTVAKNLFKIPAYAIVDKVWIFGPASNAGTTATLSVGITGTTTYFINAVDVKGNNGLVMPGAAATVANWGVSIGTAALQVVGIYAETGAASSSGGPWNVVLEFHLP